MNDRYGESEMAEKRKRVLSCAVNRRLLPVKGVYFTFMSGIGALLLFIPVYMKQLGLTSVETGIIYGIMPFIAFFVRPLFGVFADKTRKHKLVLIFCCIMTGICYCLLLVTPTNVKQRSPEGGHAQLRSHCGQPYKGKYLDLLDTNDTQHGVDRKHLTEFRASLKQFEMNMSNQYLYCKASCELDNAFANVYVHFMDAVARHTIYICENDIKSHVTDNNGWRWLSSISTIILRNLMKVNFTQDVNKLYQRYNISDTEFEDRSNSSRYCNGHTFVECKTGYMHAEGNITTEDSLSHTFWVFSVIFFFCNVFFSPVLSLVDAIAYDILGEDKRGDWGKQRLWGTVGVALFAVTSSFIMDALSKSNIDVNYTVSFVLFLGLNLLTATISYFLRFSDKIQYRMLFKNMTTLLRHSEIVIFFMLIIIMGLFNGVIEAFLFWYLTDLGSSQIILGLCLVFNCIPEIIMLHCAGVIMATIGYVPCLYLSLLAYAVRFFSYSILTNPWYVLFIEPTHAFSFALMYSAASAYASAITPPGLSATVQGLVGGLFFGFGRGIGSLVTGKLFDSNTGIGAVWTFRVYGTGSLVTLVLYATVQTIFFKKNTFYGRDPEKLSQCQKASSKSAIKGVRFNEDNLLENASVDSINSNDDVEASDDKNRVERLQILTVV